MSLNYSLALSFPPSRMSVNISAPEYFSLPFKGRAGVGMGLDFMETYPIPHEPTPILTFPLKGKGRLHSLPLGERVLSPP